MFPTVCGLGFLPPALPADLNTKVLEGGVHLPRLPAQSQHLRELQVKMFLLNTYFCGKNEWIPKLTLKIQV